MSLSHHEPDYHDMMDEIYLIIKRWAGEDRTAAQINILLHDLASTMNDYGAVSWT